MTEFKTYQIYEAAQRRASQRRTFTMWAIFIAALVGYMLRGM